MSQTAVALVAAGIGVLGSLLGVFAGGVVTYWVQWKLKTDERHREMLRDIALDLENLSAGVMHLISHKSSPQSAKISPMEAMRLARKIELRTVHIKDKELKRDILASLNQEYDHPMSLSNEISRIGTRVRRETFPKVSDSKQEYQEAPADWMGKVVKSWPGPANLKFAKKLHDLGFEDTFEFDHVIDEDPNKPQI
jgi:hypothetical protein